MFNGAADNYVEIGPCRGYFARLKGTTKDVQMTEYADTWHAYDNPLLPPPPPLFRMVRQRIAC
jgi:hypothetical protein